MSETWTPVTAQSETWTANAPGQGVFSQLVFSHAMHTGKRVFALSNPTGTVEIWDGATAQSETWTVA